MQWGLKYFGVAGAPSVKMAGVDDLDTYPSACIIMSNMVVLGQTVGVYIRRFARKKWASTVSPFKVTGTYTNRSAIMTFY